MRTTVLLLVAAAALTLPGAAAAKGASKATIEGPGLGKTLTVSGNGETAGNKLGNLAQYAGFFPAVFDQQPDPMVAKRPAGKLGPRYEIVWTMPGPDNVTSTIRQDVYPYAQPAPVTFTKPGQRYWETGRTHGGWYLGDSLLKDSLTAVGLPASAPAGGGGTDWTRWIVFAVLGSALLAAFALVTRRTRWLRPEPA